MAKKKKAARRKTTRKTTPVKRRKHTKTSKTKTPMAKKRKGTKRRSTRRARISGTTDVINVLSVAGGAVAAGFLNKVIPPTVNDKIVAVGKIALGISLPMLIRGKGQNAARAIGTGMIAVGSVDLLKSMGVLSGDFDIPVINADVLSDDELEQISGLGEEILAGEDIPVINGPDEDGEDD